MSEPELSVAVAVVEGGAMLRGCLGALAAQQGAPAFEIVVAVDAHVAERDALAREFPDVRWVETPDPPAPVDALAAHALYDRRRAAGLAAACAPLVALLVDRGWPAPDWARQLVALHAAEPAEAIGGAVVHGGAGTLRRALFVCDFGRFQPPLGDDDPAWVSDVNVAYRRDALERLRDVWQPRYQEAELHWEMRRRGDALRLRDAPVVVHRRSAARWGPALVERVQWGRNFARLASGRRSRAAALARALASPLVPAVLAWRHLRAERSRGEPWRRVAALAPALVVLVTAWGLGELAGHLESALKGRGPSGRNDA